MDAMPERPSVGSPKRAAAAARRAKRQRYTPVACDTCKKRKVKCNGEIPCRQCVTHGRTDCVYDRLLPGNSTIISDTPKESATLDGLSTVEVTATLHPLWPLSRIEAMELLESIREDVQTLYPFIDVQEMKNLVELVYFQEVEEMPHSPGSFVQTSRWNDVNDARNVEFLKLLLACAMVPREDGKKYIGSKFMFAVEENTFQRVRSNHVDIKEVAIATLLGIFHFQCDEIKLAWRQIGAAARMSLELGLHRSNSSTLGDYEMKSMPWTIKLFWCIYVLDRRYSFMTNLPFSIHDEDIDFASLQPDVSAPYLLPMVTYGRLGGKIVPAVPKFGHISNDLDDVTKTNLGMEIDRWVANNSIRPYSAPSFSSTVSSLNFKTIHDLKVFVHVRANQMRLSLYKNSLYTPSNIFNHPEFARLAVHVATDNIRVLIRLRNDSEDLYEACARHYKNFLVPALFSLYLAIRNAPEQFGETSFDYFAGLNLLKSLLASSISSEQLSITVRVLEKAISSLQLKTLDTWSTSFNPPSDFIIPPSSVTDALRNESAQHVEHNDLDLAKQANVLFPPTISAAESQFNFEIPIGTLMNEHFPELNLFQELGMNDIGLSDFLGAPDLYSNNEPTAGADLYMLPEYL